MSLDRRTTDGDITNTYKIMLKRQRTGKYVENNMQNMLDMKNRLKTVSNEVTTRQSLSGTEMLTSPATLQT